MINLPAGNLFLIETLRVFQPLARAHSEDKDFERRVEGEEEEEEVEETLQRSH